MFCYPREGAVGAAVTVACVMALVVTIIVMFDSNTFEEKNER